MDANGLFNMHRPCNLPICVQRIFLVSTTIHLRWNFFLSINQSFVSIQHKFLYKYFFFFPTLDLDPCNNASCKHYSHCEASSPQQFSCVCDISCPSYEEQVCASNGRTFRNMCLLKKEICETRGNYTHYHPGSCTGIWKTTLILLCIWHDRQWCETGSN